MARKLRDDAAPKPSKELQEMRQEEVTAEPSLAGMLEGVDLTDKRVKSFFARMSEKKGDE